MWRPVVVTVAPAVEPVPTADAKAHLRVDHADDDALIVSCVAAARSHIEAMTTTRLVTQTVAMKTDDWSDLANMPVAPLQSVSSISYTDTDGDVLTLATTVYETRLDLLEPIIVLKYGQAWPIIRHGSLITVTGVAGYGGAGAQPAGVIHALKLIVGDMYAQRETFQAGSVSTMVPVSATVDALLGNHRKHLI